MQVNTKEILLNHPSKGLAHCALDHWKVATRAGEQGATTLHLPVSGQIFYAVYFSGLSCLGKKCGQNVKTARCLPAPG